MSWDEDYDAEIEKLKQEIGELKKGNSNSSEEIKKLKEELANLKQARQELMEKIKQREEEEEEAYSYLDMI
jgi:peptidoglycan hydrolase CwlO-like protein